MLANHFLEHVRVRVCVSERFGGGIGAHGGGMSVAVSVCAFCTTSRHGAHVGLLRACGCVCVWSGPWVGLSHGVVYALCGCAIACDVYVCTHAHVSACVHFAL